jgi:hypothetical protein
MIFSKVDVVAFCRKESVTENQTSKVHHQPNSSSTDIGSIHTNEFQSSLPEHTIVGVISLSMVGVVWRGRNDGIPVSKLALPDAETENCVSTQEQNWLQETDQNNCCPPPVRRGGAKLCQ